MGTDDRVSRHFTGGATFTSIVKGQGNRRNWPILSMVALLVAASALWPRYAWAQGAPCTATGDLKIVPFASKVFPAARNLRLLLPDGYARPENAKRRYPVLYLNDGQNLFDVCTGLYGKEEWRVDETVRKLIAAGSIEPIIVVGIDSGGRRLRPKEYLPFIDKTLSPPEPNPQGRRYPNFLLGEVVPYVESHYRVLAGPDHRVLGGSSYGAGIALYTLIMRPGSFSGMLLESPSVYADNYRLLTMAKRLRNWPQRIYLGTGTEKDEPLNDVNRLERLFKADGLSASRLFVVKQVEAHHRERWWAERLPTALKFFYGNSQSRSR